MLRAGRFIYLCVLSLGLCSALNSHCSEEKYIPCDHMGFANLDTGELYHKSKGCDWTFRDKDDTVVEVVTPSPNVTVQCSLKETDLKVQCISPKYEFLACYKLNNESITETNALSSHGASHRRVHELLFIPAGLFLAMLAFLIIQLKKGKKATEKTCMATAQVEVV